jgi:hypothetical protein
MRKDAMQEMMRIDWGYAFLRLHSTALLLKGALCAQHCATFP